jgi:hypothetical protein
MTTVLNSTMGVTNFTSIPTAPTATKGDSSLKLATTEFVMNALSGVSTTKYKFVATDGQTVFNAGAVLVDPMVYLNGVLQTKDLSYTFTPGATSITFLDARVLNETVVIA